MPISQSALRSEQAEQRSQGYWLLSKLFLEVPTTERLLALQSALAALDDDDSPLRAAVAELVVAVGQAAHGAEAAIDYTRQLVALSKESGVPLPFEAHVRENRLPGDATEAIQRLMAESGYSDVVADAASPDHIGAELRLMALFCHDECQAWKSVDLNAAVDALRRQKRLLHEHLTQWAPGYCAALAERAHTTYLRAVARLTQQALAEDERALAEISVELDRALATGAQ